MCLIHEAMCLVCKALCLINILQVVFCHYLYNQLCYVKQENGTFYVPAKIRKRLNVNAAYNVILLYLTY